MTLSLAWIRQVKSVEELVVASDSRLRFGCAWDCCPKVFPLPRGDSVICFAGDTMYAYPLINQIKAVVEHHRRSLSRAQDLTDFKGHLLRVANDMCEQIGDFPTGKDKREDPDAGFLLGGYSWKLRSFVLWTLHFDAHIKKFTFRPARRWHGVNGRRVLAILGNSVDEAKTRLIRLLRARGKLTSGALDMEPLEVLRDMIRERVDPTIGGPPQVAKVYRHMSTMIYGVWWPNRASGRIALLGRPLLNYERIQNLILDPDSLQSEATWTYDGDVAG
jgi:hypothetical protein